MICSPSIGDFVGNTDTIVVRTMDATVGAFPGTATVPIEMVALQLKSTTPVLGGFAYVTLQSDRAASDPFPPGPASTGFMEITFDDENGGSFHSEITVYDDLRIGTVDAPPTDNPIFLFGDKLLTGDSSWDRIPPPQSILISDVNQFLAGLGDTSEDFFPDQITEVLQDPLSATQHVASTATFETHRWAFFGTRNRIRSLLACQGIRVGRIDGSLAGRLGAIRDWAGKGLAPGLRARMARMLEQLGWIGEQVRLLQQQCREELQQGESDEAAKVKQLMRIKGVGLKSAWILEHEFFSWREIRNGRQLGSLAGLTPTPYQSGESHREQGISKAGNRHVRAVMIQLGWLWLRYQPDSHLSQWFQQRFERGGPRTRKKGIVALSRRLLIQLWRFRETGELPPGALLTGESAS